MAITVDLPEAFTQRAERFLASDVAATKSVNSYLQTYTYTKGSSISRMGYILKRIWNAFLFLFCLSAHQRTVSALLKTAQQSGPGSSEKSLTKTQISNALNQLWQIRTCSEASKEMIAACQAFDAVFPHPNSTTPEPNSEKAQTSPSVDKPTIQTEHLPTMPTLKPHLPWEEQVKVFGEQMREYKNKQTELAKKKLANYEPLIAQTVDPVTARARIEELIGLELLQIKQELGNPERISFKNLDIIDTLDSFNGEEQVQILSNLMLCNNDNLKLLRKLFSNTTSPLLRKKILALLAKEAKQETNNIGLQFYPLAQIPWNLVQKLSSSHRFGKWLDLLKTLNPFHYESILDTIVKLRNYNSIKVAIEALLICERSAVIKIIDYFRQGESSETSKILSLFSKKESPIAIRNSLKEQSVCQNAFTDILLPLKDHDLSSLTTTIENLFQSNYQRVFCAEALVRLKKSHPDFFSNLVEAEANDIETMLWGFVDEKTEKDTLNSLNSETTT